MGLQVRESRISREALTIAVEVFFTDPAADRLCRSHGLMNGPAALVQGSIS